MNLEAEKQKKAAEEAKKLAEEQAKAATAASDSKQQLTATKEEASKYKTESEAKDKKIAELETQLTNANAKHSTAIEYAQSGRNSAAMGGFQKGADSSAKFVVPFAAPYLKPPRVIHGISHFDLESGRRRAFCGSLNDVTKSGMAYHAATWGGSFGYGFEISWMTLPENGIHFEHGSYDAIQPGAKALSNRMFFSKPFVNGPPIVRCWFYEVNKKADTEWFSLKTFASNITDRSFTINVESWAGRDFDDARVCWIAYDSAEDGKRVKSACETVTRAVKTSVGRVNFPGQPFSKIPAVFCAYSQIDMGPDRNLRGHSEISSWDTNGMTRSFGSWGDTDMDHVEVVWLAVEP